MKTKIFQVYLRGISQQLPFLHLMAKKPNKRKPTQKNTRNSGEPSVIVRFLKSEQTHFIVGLLICFFSVYLLLAMGSFLFTGGEDQSELKSRSLSDLRGLPIEDFQKTKDSIKNWAGLRGALFADFLINKTFGLSSFLFFFLLFSIGSKLMRVKNISVWKRTFFTVAAVIWGSVLCGFFLQPLFANSFISSGGRHGAYICRLLEANIGGWGTALLLIASLIVILVATSSRTIPFFRALFTLSFLKRDKSAIEQEEYEEEDEEEQTETKAGKLKRFFFWKDKEEDEEDYEDEENEPSYTPKPEMAITTTIGADTPDQHEMEVVFPADEDPYETRADKELDITIPKEEEMVENVPVDNYDPRLDLSSYKFPTLDLLKKYDHSGKAIDMDEQASNKAIIIQTLKTFGIEISSIKATVGPTITLYEIIPEAGVRITKIRNLEDDIALSLSALGIRIIAPMPGKGTIGIEVPNKEPQIVSMQSIIASKRFQESTYDLPVALGKTIVNEVFMVDLCKMPHLLVAGATGQGKSVGLNAVITSLLYKKHPAELKFVLIDPKMVEFNIYSTIERHYLAKLPDSDKAIITDFTKVVQTLKSLTQEMDERYDLLMKANTRNIKEYNEKFITRRLNPEKGHKFMPYIVVVIDEFGDLIMTAGKEIEMPIARIAQKARAVGMHMIIATQRPSANIITGTIKANFPARVAFRVSSMIDSRTILDANGANQLVGRGDMLFSQGNDMIRVQCAFVDTPEVVEIADYIGAQRGYPTAFPLPEVIDENGGERAPGSVDLSDRDPLFDEAARLLVIHQQGSTSLIQRKFAIGYNRAGRLMDQLEAAGIVGPFEGSKARQILVPDEYQLEQILNALKTP